jgi:hypothetical protein
MLLLLLAGLGSAAWSLIGGSVHSVPIPALQIEVLNGCGEPGLAQGAAERLQGLGHDVVRVGDATLVCAGDRAQEIRRLVEEGRIHELQKYF